MDISYAIRYLRKKKGWTQQQLADFASTSKGNISNLENGNQGYSPAILQNLAKAFGCSVSQIFLLAENLECTEKLLIENDKMPIDTIFIQLPLPIQEQLRQLMLQILKQQEK
ncbi:helix-turn-helix transcriptional regulator [Kingella kingae]|uniref:helix-turn-helix domain-containing protein n=1 Tax=Kingella kingae TaxID=504 RepID=UPI0013DF27CF|nr:helix-turn-helix transcriptional regulator [Kingella kingae]MBD3614525.1 helix-turn-helix transcriptional regulator [Kingella kingae]MBD3632858.1 helix-turn-helix transcriptional regulator [Kingella kingae]MBD3660167.1 helix-turn-helix transcriptional regulator [Kingella kingae]MDK4545297.1 helix-turn-helix transcriptional regulator [Kingella kingae]MDK4567317.1 helix-turn-helix transcriptional regulator [Kingella kingae]